MERSEADKEKERLIELEHALGVVRKNVELWLKVERRDYADAKYDVALREEGFAKMYEEGLDTGGYWDIFLSNYYSRAQLFGLGTLQGKQAFGKFIVTCLSALEAAVLTTGPMPVPGKRSGDVVDSGGSGG